ncbi:MAG: AAA family ATPase [Treponema sp.]|nr:AAA family ATPase [Treponema sp.]
MKYYGRKEELGILKELLGKDCMQVALIYGRRRVGKSELIKQAIIQNNTNAIYYGCKETTEYNNVESLSVLISENLGIPGLVFRGIEQSLEFIFKQSEGKDLVLVLDEYPFLHEVVKGLDSIIQSLVDRYRDTARLKLILCGSYVGVMESLLAVENPLYGRIDRTINLKPMDYYESANFYERFSDEDKVRLYSVFGGIPYYNRLIDPEKTVRQNIIELIASPGARLENEVVMYLKSEISKMNNANEVFEALAIGCSRFSDILSQSHVSSGPTLADVLEKLMHMEIVRKAVPLNDEGNRKKAGYYICDPLSMFYYRYCFRYLSQMSVMPPDQFFCRFIEDDFETWFVPRFFEEICRQYLVRQNKNGNAPIPFDRIGRYWYNDPESHTNGEFDIVTERDGEYVFYEAKFRNSPISLSMVRQEIDQVNSTGLRCRYYGFFSREGFEESPGENMLFISLSDMYI